MYTSFFIILLNHMIIVKWRNYNENVSECLLDTAYILNRVSIMLIKNYSEVPEETPSLENTKECTLRWLISEKDHALHYAMRLFEIRPGGSIPVHSHEDTEHEIFVIKGSALLNNGKQQTLVEQGDAIFIKPGEKHGFINSTNESFKFICVIPI
jgi:quercetin dioxygenase-like cupin family protein